VLSPEELKEIGLSGLDYHYSIILQHPEFIEKAKSLGLSVNVWTVNDSQTIQEMIDMNVDYITTDEPKKTMEYLQPHLPVR
jgi:glycerophosphoryl diester phosphodiesterase